MLPFLREHKRPVYATLGLALSLAVIGCGFALSTDGEGALGKSAICALGILACAIIWWVTRVLPEFITGLLMTAAFIVICNVPTEIAFSSFASPTWWLLVAAFGLGYAMQESGLLSRMANGILRAFPKTFKMQAAGLISAGTLIGPFIPSLAAKASMLAPLSLEISDAMGYPRKGKGASGLFLAMFTGIRNVGPAVISASIIGYGLLATLPSDVAARFGMLNWFLGMLPWFIVVTVLNYIAIIVMFSPDRKRTKEAADDNAGTSTKANCASINGASAEAEGEAAAASDDEQGNKVEAASPATTAKAPWSPGERRMAAIMAACVALWATEPLHGIGAHVVALCSLAAAVALGVVGAKGLSRGISWDSLIFIGCAIGLAPVLAYLGIDEWVVGLCAPAFQSLSHSPCLMAIGVGLATTALRFVIVSDMAYINVFMAFMVPLATMAGINPWVIGVCAYAMVDPWFALYQNPIYLTSFYATEGRMVENSVMARYCLVYTAICLIGLLVSVPYWQWMGIL